MTDTHQLLQLAADRIQELASQLAGFDRECNWPLMVKDEVAELRQAARNILEGTSLKSARGPGSGGSPPGGA